MMKDIFDSFSGCADPNLGKQETQFNLNEKRFEVRLKPNLKSLQATLKWSETHFKMNEKLLEVRLKPDLNETSNRWELV